MIKYFGTPVTPISVFIEHMTDKNVMISFFTKRDFPRACKYSAKIIIDNGAYSYFTQKLVPDWDKFYKWLEPNLSKINYFIIPDKIDGTEEENDALIDDCPFTEKAIPVFHLHESTERLRMLSEKFNYIAFGSSGKYWSIGSYNWHKRMDELMRVICGKDGKPSVKIHMLRCLNKEIFLHYPFYSGDSTGFARNHSKYGAEKILSRILPYNSPEVYSFKPYQLDIFDMLESVSNG